MQKEFDEMAKKTGFRPQQGLLIMNKKMLNGITRRDIVGVSVPNRGYLLWIDALEKAYDKLHDRLVSVPNRGYLLWIISGLNNCYQNFSSFRPQQGLLIMNNT